MKFNLTRRTKRRLMWASLLALIIATGLDGSKRAIADLIWPDDVAPWEKVTAVYYPDREQPNDIRVSDMTFTDLASCRGHISELAKQNGDPDLKRGRYDCAIGFYRDDEGRGDYRLRVH